MDMAVPSAAMALAQEAARDATERARRVMSETQDKNRQWYVVHNAAGNDRRALETLKRTEFEVYYPAEGIKKLVPKRKLSQKQRRSMIPVYERILKPLFARYFFVRFDLARGDWHDVFALAGIQGVLFTDDSPRPLPARVADSEIARFKSHEVDGAIPTEVVRKFLMRETDEEAAPYRIGEEVRISEGPFAGHNGTVDSLPKDGEPLDESARLKLLVSLFGRKSVVEMALSDIEKL